MIELKTLAKMIENQLNALGNNVFKIFADMGDYKKAYRAQQSNEITNYINGVLEALTPTILPIKNLQVVTQTIRIAFPLSIDLLNKDSDGNYIELTNIRALLAQYIATNNAVPSSYTDLNNVVFEITPTFDGVTVGIASQISPIGDVLPVYLDGVYTFIESGVNSNSTSIVLNGEDLYFEKASITRVRPSETNVFNGEISTKTVVQSNGISIGINLPLLDTEQGNLIENDILDGGLNNAQLVQYIRNGKAKNYIMVFGENNESLEMAKNIGFGISLVEGRRDILNYNANWTTQTLTVNAGQTVNIEMTGTYYSVMFWGDGTSDFQTSGNFSHTYSNAGTYTLYLYTKIYSIQISAGTNGTTSYSLDGGTTQVEIQAGTTQVVQVIDLNNFGVYVLSNFYYYPNINLTNAVGTLTNVGIGYGNLTTGTLTNLQYNSMEQISINTSFEQAQIWRTFAGTQTGVSYSGSTLDNVVVDLNDNDTIALFGLGASFSAKTTINKSVEIICVDATAKLEANGLTITQGFGTLTLGNVDYPVRFENFGTLLIGASANCIVNNVAGTMNAMTINGQATINSNCNFVYIEVVGTLIWEENANINTNVYLTNANAKVILNGGKITTIDTSSIEFENYAISVNSENINVKNLKIRFATSPAILDCQALSGEIQNVINVVYSYPVQNVILATFASSQVATLNVPKFASTQYTFSASGNNIIGTKI